MWPVFFETKQLMLNAGCREAWRDGSQPLGDLAPPGKDWCGDWFECSWELFGAFLTLFLSPESSSPAPPGQVSRQGMGFASHPH